MTKDAATWLLAGLLGAGMNAAALGQSPVDDARKVFRQVPLTEREVGGAALPPRWGGRWRWRRGDRRNRWRSIDRNPQTRAQAHTSIRSAPACLSTRATSRTVVAVVTTSSSTTT